MACVLWNDGVESGCIDIPPKEVGVMIGRFDFPDRPRHIPRTLLEFFRFGDYWQVRKRTIHDYISVWAYSKGQWIEVTDAPETIDEWTMVQARINLYCLRFILNGSEECQGVTIATYSWEPSLWAMPTDEPTPSRPHPIPEQTLPYPEQRVMNTLDWLAAYLSKNTWAALLAILLMAGGIVGWTLLTHHPLPAIEKSKD